MTPKAEELKACPFCGADPVVKASDTTERFSIYCDHCEFAQVISRTEKLAVEQWNTRHTPELEELKHKAWERGMRDAIAEASSTGISKDEMGEGKSKLDCICAWWNKARRSIESAIDAAMKQ